MTMVGYTMSWSSCAFNFRYNILNLEKQIFLCLVILEFVVARNGYIRNVVV